MIEFGEISLSLALVLSLYAVVTSFISLRNSTFEFWWSAKRAVISNFLLLSVSIGILAYSLAIKNYSLKYVAEHVSNGLPTFYAISALWAGQSGSLLLWAWLLSLFTLVVLWQNRNFQFRLIPHVITTLSAILFFFLILLVFITNPFERMAFAVTEGQGLNPLLQNPGMMFHPPTLYLGYVGFSVPFAFAIAALLNRKLDSEWIVLTRRWTLFAWLFLSIGILLGAKWAYVELGWGGYWGWDPVENASLMPWLTGTAFLHSVMIQERRGMLKIWNVSLIVITFLLTIFGTFVTRSGIISSVHSFGASSLGYVFLAFLVLLITVSVYLIFTRREELRSDYHFDSYLSRESSFLFNNLILVGSAFAILWGTLFPVISEAVRGVKITVGPPFFNSVNVPIGIVLILLTGVGPLIAWRKASTHNLVRNFLYPGIGFFLALIILWFIGIRDLYPLLSFSLISFVLTGIVMEFYRGVRARKRVEQNIFRAFINLILKHRRRYGGYIVHIGVMLIFIGITGSSAFKAEVEKTLRNGETINLKNYQLTFLGVDYYKTANAEVLNASFRVKKDNKDLGVITPAKEYHPLQDQTMTEVAILSDYREDLYLILGGVDDDAVYVKAHINPLVAWIWWGGYVLIIGTLIAMWPSKKREATQSPVPKKTFNLKKTATPIGA
ncbi:MAG: heme lyase CcmF/NrfE family subunit [Calditrichaeota bacterium]|nr:MAG: heme lyase CcmF/NrfE family subunit [Calditrichota bacterium]